MVLSSVHQPHPERREMKDKVMEILESYKKGEMQLGTAILKIDDLNPRGDEDGLLKDFSPFKTVERNWYGDVLITGVGYDLVGIAKAQRDLTRREGQERVERIFEWFEQRLGVPESEGYMLLHAAPYELSEFKKQEGL